MVRSSDKIAIEIIFILTVEMHEKDATRSFTFTRVLSYCTAVVLVLSHCHCHCHFSTRSLSLSLSSFIFHLPFSIESAVDKACVDFSLLAAVAAPLFLH